MAEFDVVKVKKYPRVTSDGKVIAVDPASLPNMREGRREWFNPDGTARSIAELEAKKCGATLPKAGPDDKDMLG